MGLVVYINAYWWFYLGVTCVVGVVKSSTWGSSILVAGEIQRPLKTEKEARQSRFLAALSLLMALTGCVGYSGPSDITGTLLTDARQAHAEGKTFILDYSGGGNPTSTRSIAKAINDENISVEIRGICGSSCVLFLSITKLCYSRDSEFILHGLSTFGKYSKHASDAYAYYLPPKLAQWAKDNNALSDPDKLYTLSGKEMARLDNTPRLCD